MEEHTGKYATRVPDVCPRIAGGQKENVRRKTSTIAARPRQIQATKCIGRQSKQLYVQHNSICNNGFDSKYSDLFQCVRLHRR